MAYARALGISVALLMSSASTLAHAQVRLDLLDFEAKEQVFDAPTGPVGPAGPVSFGGPIGSSPGVIKGFQGISQYDVAALGRNFIPPDTMGAVGSTQIMEFVNGGVAVFDKATGVRTSIQSDVAFWAAAGRTGANGDSRVMYDASSGRWIALSFASSVSQIQIGVSDTSNALGPWQSTVFTGYAGLGFGATADYPTLALTQNSVIIGTNDFAPSTAGGPNSFRGTSLDIIPLNSLLGAGAPSVAGGVSFFTGCCGAGSDFTRGFAIQGVNGSGAGGIDAILAVSLEANALTTYNVTGVTPLSSLGASRTASTDFLGGGYDGNGPGRQPDLMGTGNGRVIDTLDDRVGSSVYQVNGRIYSVHTITEIGSDFTSVRYDVMDAVTHQILSEGDIGLTGYDFYEGSLAVNAQGQVVIAYNRSGSSALNGLISILARSYNTNADGSLTQIGDEVFITSSATDSYHNGSIDGLPGAGRQRWGDYSAVSLDPTDPTSFWVIGEFAREFNDAANGHPGGTGGSRWGTYIAQINLGAAAVPEPSTWGMLILGFGLAGLGLRRRRAVLA